MDAWELIDAGFFGDPQELAALDVVGCEDAFPGTSDLAQESRASKIRDLQVAGTARRRTSGRLSLLEEEFEEGPERDLFIFLRDRVRATYQKEIPEDRRWSAIEWCFTNEENPITFEETVTALGARSHVVLMRLQYEFYRRWIVFSRPLPFMAVALPDDVTSEVIYFCGDDGLKVASAVWYWPGIDMDQLRARADALGIRDAWKHLERLEELRLVMEHMGNWYFTGVRPREREVYKGMS